MSAGIFRNIFWVRTFPIICDLNSVIQIALAPDRTGHTDMHRAIALMEQKEHQVRASAQERAVLGLLLPLCPGLPGARRAATKSCGDLGK